MAQTSSKDKMDKKNVQSRQAICFSHTQCIGVTVDEGSNQNLNIAQLISCACMLNCGFQYSDKRSFSQQTNYLSKCAARKVQVIRAV